MDVSKNRGTPKSSISIGFSIINHPFWGVSLFSETSKWWVVFFHGFFTGEDLDEHPFLFHPKSSDFS